jgi:membrane protease subunit HflC
MSTRTLGLLVVVVAALLLLWHSTFTVSETELAVRTHFGQVVGADYAPGLHLKSPFDHVYRFDRRIATAIYAGEPAVTRDSRPLNVDCYVKWRIIDPLRYFNGAGGDENTAALRLADVVRDHIKAAIAGETLAQVAAAPRAGLTEQAFAAANAGVAPLGIALVDVELQRIDLGDELENAVYQRMQSAFSVQAKQTRAAGDADAETIRVGAERDRSDALGNGVRESQRIRGEGDAAAASTYAKAYGRNPEFAAFYRSLQAYGKALGRDGDVLVLSPDSEFFKYLRAPGR